MWGYRWACQKVCKQGRDDGKNDVRWTYGDVTTPRPPAIDDVYIPLCQNQTLKSLAPRLDMYIPVQINNCMN